MRNHMNNNQIDENGEIKNTVSRILETLGSPQLIPQARRLVDEKVEELQSILDDLTPKIQSDNIEFTTSAALNQLNRRVKNMEDTLQSAISEPESVTGLASEIASGKQAIANAINAKGGEASATESFSELAESISEIPNFDDMVKLAGIIAGGNYNKNVLQGHNENVKYGKTEIIDTVGGFEVISVSYCFQNWDLLERVVMPNLTTLSGDYAFSGCVALQEIDMPNLTTITPLGPNIRSLEEFNFPNVTTFNRADNIWSSYTALKRIILPSLSYVNNQSYYGFFGSPHYNFLVEFMKLGTIVTDLGGNELRWNYLRNFEVGYGTNANINFGVWRATNVIAEGAAAIAELNTNIMNGIVANLLQGAGKTFTVGSTLYNVLYPETLQAFVDKGWNIASA